MNSTRIAARIRSHHHQTHTVSYRDCILGKVGMPKDKKHKAVFQTTLMIGSVPVTSTINWLINTPNPSLSEFFQYLILYPLFLALAITVRFLFANPLVNPLVKRVIVPHLDGLKKSLSITIINVLIMGTLVALFRAIMLSGGPSAVSWATFASSLPLSYLISFMFSYFIASPLTKKLYARSIEPHVDIAIKKFSLALRKISLKDILVRWANNRADTPVARQKVRFRLRAA